ncbi:MAG: MBOAT family protein [Planctomycetales bacterium]|nr:MBOAT family protein [Planctomycetales bacterium]
MLFNSYVFALVFLPLVLFAWWSERLSQRTRLTALVAASYFFYGWWDYRFVSLLLFSTVLDYCCGHVLESTQRPAIRRAALLISMLANLGLLVFFKYSGFLARSVNALTGAISGSQPLPVWDIILPVGISFYTFQTMSYTIDIYLRKAKPATSLLHFAAYVSMFPQLVAGPIVRYTDLEEQLRQIRTRPDWEQMARGLFFFAGGLGQKLLLADLIAARVDPLLADYGTLQLQTSWYAMLGYTCQLYFDFAGYSNMAVGLGLMLGFQFPQNFDSPYKSRNISEFWRRWHMTLSSFLRDYLFVPLGGSRYGQWLTLRNLVIVMFLGGLWHGAGWTFVIWGLYHGLLLVVHRVAQITSMRRLPQGLAALLTFLCVVIGWTFFRAQDLTMAGSLLWSMIGGHGMADHTLESLGGIRGVGLLGGLLLIIFAMPNLWQIRFRPTRAWALAVAALLLICVLRFDSQSPFLYFQF